MSPDKGLELRNRADFLRRVVEADGSAEGGRLALLRFAARQKYRKSELQRAL